MFQIRQRRWGIIIFLKMKGISLSLCRREFSHANKIKQHKNMYTLSFMGGYHFDMLSFKCAKFKNKLISSSKVFINSIFCRCQF